MFDVFSMERKYNVNVKVSTGKNVFSVVIDDDDADADADGNDEAFSVCRKLFFFTYIYNFIHQMAEI